MLETGYLDHPELGVRDTDVNQRLDLESIAPALAWFAGRPHGAGVKSHDRKVLSPEDIEAVAQVRVPDSVERIDDAGQDAIPQPPQPGDVGASAALGESGSLGEVSARQQNRDEGRDLGCVV
jgi:hypothetical protein